MDADGAVHVLETIRDTFDCLEAGQTRADGLDDADTRLPGTGDDFVQFSGEIRKIEMAMTVDQHQAAPCSSSR